MVLPCGDFFNLHCWSPQYSPMDPPSRVSQLLPSIFFFSFMVLTFPLFTTAQEPSRQNISLGSSLTPLGQPNSWASPSGDFAFGFLPVEANNLSSPFILGVYFNRVPDKTLVWYANGGSPVQDGAKVELTVDGKLVLQDHGGNSVWSNSNGSNIYITHAAMLDNGNFILANMTSSNWETFQNPTDTILPEQTLDLGAKLTTRLTDTDYSQGRFQLSVESNGNLALYPINIETGFQYKQYWDLGTSGNGSKLVFDKSGDLFMVLRNGSVVNVFSSPSTSEGKQFFYRATLETDGVFRYYLLPSNGASNSDQWMILSQQPVNICDALNRIIGIGSACGYNSFCVQNITDTRPNCLCPTGYSFLDSNRKYLGCRPDIPLPFCNGSDIDPDAYEFKEMMNVEWPFSDYEQYSPFTEDDCRAECLKDCFCVVAIYRNVSCWKKQFPLAYGFGNANNQGKVLLKTARANYTTSCIDANPPQVNQENKGKWFVTSIVLISSSVFFFLSMLVAIPLLYSLGKRRMALLQRFQRQSPDFDSYLGIKMQSFTFKSLQEATRNFEDEIGRGAFGVVFRGTLSSSRSKVWNVAVKVLHQFMEGVEKEFLNEVRSIGQTHHKNLVRLFGYCNEGSHRMLVYEFMEKGSLMCLFSRNPRLSWKGRTQIADGIAKGLQYLHEECDTQIIHCDIKPQNILLDESLVAKISDFGLAKLLKADQTQTSTGIRGTRGYVAPEWFKGRTISTKIDVYSFGVILLEIICCRKNVEREFGESERAILTDWAYDSYAEEKLDLLVEDDEEGQINMIEFERYVMVALWCIQEEPTRRPSMRKVIQLLAGEIDVCVPPDPSL